MVKVDEHQKLYLTTQRLIFYHYLQVVAGRKKRGMETVSTN